MKRIDELGIIPTPWYVRDNGMAGVYINAVSCDSEENQIAVMDTYISGEMSMQKEAANARLIASAPELYEALRKMLAVARNRLPSQPTLDEIEVLQMAESVLAKASGESEAAND